jgi:hypothetical protein
MNLWSWFNLVNWVYVFIIIMILITACSLFSKKFKASCDAGKLTMDKSLEKGFVNKYYSYIISFSLSLIITSYLLCEIYFTTKTGQKTLFLSFISKNSQEFGNDPSDTRLSHQGSCIMWIQLI